MKTEKICPNCNQAERVPWRFWCAPCEAEIKAESDRKYAEERAKHCYLTTAEKEYSVTSNQLHTAIRTGVISAEMVRNPHCKSSPPSIILKRAEIVEKLAEIQALPRYSEDQKAAQALSRERSKFRIGMEVDCPHCGEKIKARKDSRAFAAAFDGDLDEEEAKKLILGAHIRHEHTDYDAIRAAEYEKKRQAGLTWEEAHFVARHEARRKI